MTVAVIASSPAAAARAGGRLHGMRVVEADEALPGTSMKRQRVVDPVRSLRRRWHTLDVESHPMVPCGVNHQDLAVQIEQRVQAGSRGDLDMGILSYIDNVLALPTLPSVREERPPQIDGRYQARRLSIDGVQGAGCQAPVEGNDQDLPLPAGRDTHQLGMAAPLSGDFETHAVEDTQHVAGREASQTRHQSVASGAS